MTTLLNRLNHSLAVKMIVCLFFLGMTGHDTFSQVTAIPSNGSGFLNFIGNKPWITQPFFGDRGTFIADVTGDKLADYIVVNNDGIKVRPSNGHQFFDFLGNHPWTTEAYYGSRGTFFADVTGDGKSDAIVVNDGGVTVRVSDGTRFLPNAAWTNEAYYGSRGTYFADVNGDGKADAIVVNDSKVTVRISDGTKFLPNASWTAGPYYGSRGTYFADVNGDGKADAIVVNDGGVTVRISDGTQFLPNSTWTSNPYYGTRGTYFADVNGDGKADAIVINDNSITVRISDGTKFVPNASWYNGNFYGNHGNFFADVTGDGKADAIEVKGPPIIVKRRIAGAAYLKFQKGDPQDWYGGQNGFLLVSHNPGCGIVGNDGADKFFGAAGKVLPAGCSLVSMEFRQFWPAVRGFDSPWSWLDDAGSYGAVLKSPDYTIRWHNACTGAYDGKNLYYLVSFIISMPEGTDLGEPNFDPASSMFNAFTPPPGYGWVEPPAPVTPTPPNDTTKPPVKLTNFYFKITCSGIFNTCTTVYAPAVDKMTALTALQNENPGCDVEETDLDGYYNGCH
ncbi:MAG: VCBS repeat-containing protein [Chitinophagaceae bacterium]